MPDNGSTDSDDVVSLDAPRADRDRDGVDSLRDVDSEQGDEAEVDDLFVLDETEARELGVDFTGDQRDEPRLD
jgi:hypothetical protein